VRSSALAVVAAAPLAAVAAVVAAVVAINIVISAQLGPPLISQARLAKSSSSWPMPVVLMHMLV